MPLSSSPSSSVFNQSLKALERETSSRPPRSLPTRFFFAHYLHSVKHVELSSVILFFKSTENDGRTSYWPRLLNECSPNASFQESPSGWAHFSVTKLSPKQLDAPSSVYVREIFLFLPLSYRTLMTTRTFVTCAIVRGVCTTRFTESGDTERWPRMFSLSSPSMAAFDAGVSCCAGGCPNANGRSRPRVVTSPTIDATHSACGMTATAQALQWLAHLVGKKDIKTTFHPASSISGQGWINSKDDQSPHACQSLIPSLIRNTVKLIGTRTPSQKTTPISVLLNTSTPSLNERT